MGATWVVALKYAGKEYKLQGFEFPDTCQFDRDTNSILILTSGNSDHVPKINPKPSYAFTFRRSLGQL